MDDDDDDDDYASDNGLHTGVEPGFVDGKRLKTGHEIIQGTARISSQQNLHDSGAGEGSAQMGGVGTHPPVVIPDDDDDDNEIENPAMIRTEHPSEPERNNQAQAEVKAEPDIASREGARNVNEGLQNLQLATIQDVHRAEGPACKPTTPASGYPSFSTSQLNSTRVLFKLSDRTHGVAARLSSCLTFSQFYVSLVKALELQGKTHQIELITASVHWLKCSYQLKAFEEGSDLLFKLLLEEIQQWWGWKEGGKKSCTVIVEVRMKD